MKLIVRKAISKKNNPYAMLILDTGFRKLTLTMDSGICAEALDISVKELMSLDDGFYVVFEENNIE